ncbi:MAG TPA: non-homologous end-joining DNA ligase [Opitutaceae bacterium]|nr:non-homologous end-joining DNA ligase [Opitutaceae bacterium]
MSRRKTVLHVGGRDLEVSNLDKVLYPEAGFTKGDVINYYTAVSPVLLPHLAGRALTLKRYPDGVDRFFFYEKSCPPHRPRWIRTANVPSSGKPEGTNYCVVDTLPALVWAANLADLELHVPMARAKTPQRPTAMVFDLDPGPGADLVDCARVALEIRDRLAASGLAAFPKTSGSKGLQVYVPLNTPRASFDHTKAAAREMAEALAAAHPGEVTAVMRRALRRGKVLVDWSQNDDHKTTVCAYSLRATPRPGVSTPLAWTEVTAALKSGPGKLRFSPDAVLARVRKHGDLFAPVLELRQKL